AGKRLRYTAGARYVHTSQTIGGYVSLPDPRNLVTGANSEKPPAAGAPPSPQDGGLYPNVVNFVYTHNDYHNILPSAELAYNIMDNVIVRAAGSRTMTRPDPSAMLPGVSFSSPSADTGTVGNPALKPFLSDNFDLGLEYYTGQEGFIG